MNRHDRIYVAGHRGLVGSAILRKLTAEGYGNVITRSLDELDLTSQAEVRAFFEAERPQFVFVAAAKVGGIWANKTYPAEFIYQNLMIQSNVIHAAYRAAVEKLLFLGSSCIYPRDCPQPMKEEHLLTGELEPTNEPYAVAKIAGIKTCQSYNRQYGTRFISLMPTNLYGPEDNFDLETSHVLPALIRKFHIAKKDGAPFVEIWGTGTPRREFLYVDDLADACVFIMNMDDGAYESLLASEPPLVNIGWGEDLKVSELATLIKKVVGYAGEIRFDAKRPDGTPRKLLDISKLKTLGWAPAVSLEYGIRKTYQWCLDNGAFDCC